MSHIEFNYLSGLKWPDGPQNTEFNRKNSTEVIGKHAKQLGTFELEIISAFIQFFYNLT